MTEPKTQTRVGADNDEYQSYILYLKFLISTYMFFLKEHQYNLKVCI